MHTTQADRVQQAHRALGELSQLIYEVGQMREFTHPGPPQYGYDPYDAYTMKEAFYRNVNSSNMPLIMSIDKSSRTIHAQGIHGAQPVRDTRQYHVLIEQLADVLNDLSQHINDQEQEIQELEAAYEEATTTP